MLDGIRSLLDDVENKKFNHQLKGLLKKNFLLRNYDKSEIFQNLIYPCCIVYLFATTTTMEEKKNGTQGQIMAKEKFPYLVLDDMDSWMFPIYFPIVFSQVLRYVIVQVLQEKNTNVRDCLSVMGMYDMAYILSWSISEALMNILVTIPVVIISTYCNFFKDVDPVLLFLLLSMFVVTTSQIGLLCGTLFSNASLACQVTTGMYILSGILYHLLVGSNWYWLTQIISFFVPPVSLSFALARLRGTPKLSYSTFLIQDTTVPLTIVAMAFDTILLFFLNLYYSEYRSKYHCSKYHRSDNHRSEYHRSEYHRSEYHCSDNHRSKCNFNWAKSSKAYYRNIAVYCKMILSRTSRTRRSKSSLEPIRTMKKWEIPHDQGCTVDCTSVDLCNLTKVYHHNGEKVLNNLSLQLYQGQILCLLGANGAGKTTLLRILTGLITDFEGEGTIYGLDIKFQMKEIRQILGYCGQEDTFLEQFTVKENLEIFGRMKGIAMETMPSTLESILEKIGLANQENCQVSSLSGGMKRKLSIGIALLGNPKFLILDELTAGIDLIARREIWKLLLSLKRERTIVVTTHCMDEAEALGDQLAIMTKGKLVCSGSLLQLKKQYHADYQLIVSFPHSNINNMKEMERNVITIIPNASRIRCVKEEEMKFLLPIEALSDFPILVKQLETEQTKENITGVSIAATSLHQLFQYVSNHGNYSTSLSNCTMDSHGISKDSEMALQSSKVRNDILCPANACPSNFAQIYAIFYRRILCSTRSSATFMSLLPPVFSIITMITDSTTMKLTSNSWNDSSFAVIIPYAWIHLTAPIAELIVNDRQKGSADLMFSMGCRHSCYWIGNFLADGVIGMATVFSTLLSIVYVWDMSNNSDIIPGVFLILVCATFATIAFSYFVSFLFSSSKPALKWISVVAALATFIPVALFALLISLFFSESQWMLPWVFAITPFGAMSVAFHALLQEVDSKFIIKVGEMVNVLLLQTILYLIFTCGLSKLRRKRNTRGQGQGQGLKKGQSHRVASIVSPTFSNSHDPQLMMERNKVMNRQQKNEDALRLVNLTKIYQDSTVPAVKDTCLSIAHGEAVGLLGPNGAGKSSLMSLISLQNFDYSGSILWNGENSPFCGKNQFSSPVLGVCSQKDILWPELTVREHLLIYSDIKGIPSKKRHAVVDATLATFGLTSFSNHSSDILSGGNRRKLSVAIAVMGVPRLLLLDEPSTGMDPISRQRLWDTLSNFRILGDVALLLSSHCSQEVEELCSRVGIVVDGELKGLDSPHRLSAKFGRQYNLRISLKTSMKQLSTVKHQFFVDTYMQENLGVHLDGNGWQPLSVCNYLLSSSQTPLSTIFHLLNRDRDYLEIEDYSITPLSLEYTFLRVVSNSISWKKNTLLCENTTKMTKSTKTNTTKTNTTKTSTLGEMGNSVTYIV